MPDIKRIINRISLAIVSALAACLILAGTVSAAEKDNKRVRVGWYQSDLFQEGTSDEEEKWGYSYSYLQVVASYSGWEYDYVYGDWPELLEMLRNGQIDIMAGVSDTPERGIYLFSIL